MRLAAIVSGLGGVALLALGLNMIVPLSGAVDSLCNVAGVASTVMFFGLVEGA